MSFNLSLTTGSAEIICAVVRRAYRWRARVSRGGLTSLLGGHAIVWLVGSESALAGVGALIVVLVIVWVVVGQLGWALACGRCEDARGSEMRVDVPSRSMFRTRRCLDMLGGVFVDVN